MIKYLQYLLVILPIASAEAAMSVDSVNYPVWVERESISRPLAPGDALLDGDVVSTGASGRAWLSIDEGSVVKLGQRARFVVRRAVIRDAAGGSLLDAAFDVVRGAFRFTSNFFRARRPASHQLEMQVGAITIGIRGTDIWGRSAEGEDFVALLEGRIEASTDDDALQVMDQPLTLYRKLSGEPAGPVSTVDAASVAKLAPETELSPDVGTVAREGPIDLVLMSLGNSDWVDVNLSRFHRAGFAAVAETFQLNGVSTTRLLLRGVVDTASARGLQALIADEFGIEDSWLLLR